MSVLSDALKKMNMQERFQLFEASPRCVGDFNQKLDTFINKIAAMPPKLMKTEAKASV